MFYRCLTDIELSDFLSHEEAFTNEELKLLFKRDSVVIDVARETTNNFIKHDDILRKKEILTLIRFEVLKYVTGIDDCKNNIELAIIVENRTTGIKKNNFNTEPFTEDLTNEEFLLLMKKKIKYQSMNFE